MRSFRMLLLVLALLPGLLVPPGLVVRCCQCRPAPASSPATESCCLPSADPAPAADRGCGHCRGDAAPPAPGLAAREFSDWGFGEPTLPSASPKACACVIELPATDDQSDVPPLPNLAQLPPPQLTWRPKHLANPMAGGALPPAQRLRAPPPPDRERNLPLRI